MPHQKPKPKPHFAHKDDDDSDSSDSDEAIHDARHSAHHPSPHLSTPAAQHKSAHQSAHPSAHSPHSFDHLSSHPTHYSASTSHHSLHHFQASSMDSRVTSHPPSARRYQDANVITPAGKKGQPSGHREDHASLKQPRSDGHPSSQGSSKATLAPSTSKQNKLSKKRTISSRPQSTRDEEKLYGWWTKAYIDSLSSSKSQPSFAPLAIRQEAEHNRCQQVWILVIVIVVAAITVIVIIVLLIIYVNPKKSCSNHEKELCKASKRGNDCIYFRSEEKFTCQCEHPEYKSDDSPEPACIRKNFRFIHSVYIQ